MTLKIVEYPHPALMYKSVPLRKVDSALRDMIQEMFQLLYVSKGVGLAANQVALPYRLFVMNSTGDPQKKEHEFIMINPVITLSASKPILAEEGCLSVPGLYANVLRSPAVTVHAYDLSGTEKVYKFEGFAARVVQHEYDHLDGIPFLKRLSESEFSGEPADWVRKHEAAYRKARSSGEIPEDSQILADLEALVKLRGAI